MESNLVDWLADELEGRGWSLRELARRAGISHTSISKVLTRQQAPTWDFCSEIAAVFELPPAAVFVMAGLLPAPQPALADEQEAIDILRRLPPETRLHALAMLRGLAGLPAVGPPPRILGREEPQGETNEYDVPLDLIRSLAERVVRLSPKAQGRVMDALLQLMDTMAE